MHKKYYILLVFVALTLLLSPAYATIRTQRLQFVDAETRLPLNGDPVRPYLTMHQGEEITDRGDANGLVVELSWDEMSHDVHQYTYTVVHTDRFWQPDELMSSEYLGGFTTKDVTDYEHSLNTRQIYTHYRLTLPNEDMTLRVSGNYLIRVYEDGNPDQIVVEQRLRIVDEQVALVGHITPNTDIELSGRYQQLEIALSGTRGATPRNEYMLCVEQNGRQDNAVYDVAPTMVGTNRMEWTHSRDLIFEGGSEFRHLDIYSTYLAGENVNRVVYDQGDYHALLYTDEVMDGAYIHRYDAHGQYKINAERTYDDDIEAEYMWVYWTLDRPEPWFDGAIYIGGDIFGNEMTLENRMQYDNEARCYYLTALVKQGGYDYQYRFREKGQKKTTLQRVEGSHWQTRNEYRLMVYYHPFGGRYDQLVGMILIGQE